MFRLAHISDLHFSQVSWNPLQFFSKRWVGNWNLILRRKREFNPEVLLDALIEKLLSEQVHGVVISGDLSCTSLEKEFLQASNFIDKLRSAALEVIVLPGNHDHYTKSAYKNEVFYQFFQQPLSLPGFSLKKNRIFVKHLDGAWWFIGMDTALPTSLFSCHGNFSEQIELQLEKALSQLPEDAYVIIANHFPIFTQEHESRHLQRDDALKALMKRHPKIKLYLHGHTHRHCIADLRNAQLPIILDSGSVTHKTRGSWNLLECRDQACLVQAFQWKNQSWTSASLTHFTW